METIKKFKPIECPNCGAPLRSENCEYCGSHIDLGTNLQIEIEYRRLKEELEKAKLAAANAELSQCIVNSFHRDDQLLRFAREHYYL